MIWIITGIISFAALVLFEIQKCKANEAKSNSFNPWFILGTLLLIGTFAGEAYNAQLAGGLRMILGILILLVGIGLYVKVLTGGLSKANYCMDQGKSALCKTGAYGKVRHPGVWCFLLVSIGFGLLFEGSMIFALIMALLNLIYTYLQDKYYFPAYIEGYEEYKKEIPYLFPKK